MRHEFSKRAVMLLCCASCCAVVEAQHTGDMWVGRTSGGQLTWDRECPVGGGGCGYDPSITITVLPSDPFGGWSDDTPGFDRIIADQPAEDLFQLEPGADVWLEIVATTDTPWPGPDPALEDLLVDPALYIFEPLTLRFYPDVIGGVVQRELRLGSDSLHKHVLWFIDDMDPAFDASDCIWEIVLRLKDKGSTNYLNSEPFTLSFSTIAIVPGDLDCDEDVDADDLAIFEACATGPGIPYDPENLPPGCDTHVSLAGILAADLDRDGDADQTDLGLIQGCMTDPDEPFDPHCAD